MNGAPPAATIARSGWLALLAAALAGAVFGVGLAVSRMIDPRKVLAFLDVAGAWDPSLLLVIGGAVVVAAVGYRLVLGRRAPWLEPRFHLPAARSIDLRLVGGSALFGVGWGLVGYCPGPAIASLGFLGAEAWWFVPGLAMGWLLARPRGAPAAD